jgi:hypothetical protein
MRGKMGGKKNTPHPHPFSLVRRRVLAERVEVSIEKELK